MIFSLLRLAAGCPQADCPEDVPSYIHRVGRTARYVSAGKGLLLLLPSEREGMLAQVGPGGAATARAARAGSPRHTDVHFLAQLSTASQL